MNKDDLISIIVPSYNASKTIEKAIKSLLSQSYKNIEIIVVDDGSTDKTLEIITELSKQDGRIKCIKEENSGVSSARNKGIESSNGNYISFVDADDYVEKDYILEMYNCIKQYDVLISGCCVNKVYESGAIVNDNAVVGLLTADEFADNILRQKGLGVCRNKLYKKSLIENKRFNPNYSLGEDVLFNLDLKEDINNIYISEKRLYNYTVNKTSAVRSYDSKYPNKYESLLNEIKKKKIDLDSYYDYACFVLLTIIVNYCCHPYQHKNIFETAKTIKEIANKETFNAAIYNSNIYKFTFIKRACIICLRFRAYLVLSILGKLRQKLI